MWTKVKDEIAALWCHQVSYLVMALVYSAGQLGMLAKDASGVCVVVLYLVLASQRH